MASKGIKQFSWLVRREFWEHRSFYIVPLVVMAIFFVSILVSLVQGVRQAGLMGVAINHINQLDSASLPNAGEMVMAVMGLLFMFAMGILGIFYLLDCLYAERRDRSVLFWKSLPLTDTSTVLAKFFVGVVLIPIISAIAAMVAYMGILLIATILFAISGEFPLGPLWNPLNLISGFSKMFSLELMVSLWYLPVSAWLIFCSAFARKAPFLWAALTPAAIILAENLIIGRSFLAETVGNYFERLAFYVDNGAQSVGSAQLDFSNGSLSVDGSMPGFTDMFSAFGDLALYAGLAVAVAFIVATIWWRRNRVEYG